MLIFIITVFLKSKICLWEANKHVCVFFCRKPTLRKPFTAHSGGKCLTRAVTVFSCCCVNRAPSAAITLQVISVTSKHYDFLTPGHPLAPTVFTCCPAIPTARKVTACDGVCVGLRGGYFALVRVKVGGLFLALWHSHLKNVQNVETHSSNI